MNKSYTIIVPEKPSTLAEKRVFVYVPKATYYSEGIAKFEATQFNISNGEVELKPQALAEPMLAISINEPTSPFINMWYKWLYVYTKLGIDVAQADLNISADVDGHMNQDMRASPIDTIAVSSSADVSMASTLATNVVDSMTFSVIATPGVSKVAFDTADSLSITASSPTIIQQLNRSMHITDTINITAGNPVAVRQLNQQALATDTINITADNPVAVRQINQQALATDTINITDAPIVTFQVDIIVVVTDSINIPVGSYLPVEVQYFGQVDIIEHLLFVVPTPDIISQLNRAAAVTDTLLVEDLTDGMAQLFFDTAVSDDLNIVAANPSISKFETTNYIGHITDSLAITTDTIQSQTLFTYYTVPSVADIISIAVPAPLVTPYIWPTIFEVGQQTINITLSTPSPSVEQNELRFLVRFIDFYGNSIVSAEQLVYQYDNAIAPTPPVITGYNFNFWDGIYTNVTASIDIHAVYSIISYSVVFVHPDSGVMATIYVDHGGSVLPHQVPTATKLGHTFSHWSRPYTNVTDDITTTARFTIDTFTVDFYQRDGDPAVGNWFLGNWYLSKRQLEVPWNTAATEPTRLDLTAYTFDGWASSFNQVTSDLEVYAWYSLREYTVTWYNWEGTELKVEQVGYNYNATPPTEPTRVGYTFAGWDTAYSNITANTIITATYLAEQYTVNFVDYDGTILKSQVVDYNTSATPPTNPTRVGYTFNYWSGTYTNVTSNRTITAQYSAIPYTVTWYNWEGTELKVEQVNYGSSATPPTEPTRVGYTFAGWDTAYSNITANTIITATYTEIPKVWTAATLTTYNNATEKGTSTIAVDYNEYNSSVGCYAGDLTTLLSSAASYTAGFVMRVRTSTLDPNTFQIETCGTWAYYEVTQ